MSLSVKFNDYELSDILDVEIGLNTFEGADWARELRSIPNATGSTLISSKVGVKVIDMPFRVKDGVNVKYDDLQRILNTKEVKRLTFGHMPNRYFMAVSSGTTDFKERVAGFIGHGTIKWLVTEGVSHSTDTKIVTASVVDGILTANVNNNGSDSVWPTYRFRSTADNGWYGIVHAGGTLELGNRDDVDGYDYKQDETLLDTTSFSDPEWSNWSGVYPPDTRFDLTGTTKVSGEGSKKGLQLATFGNNTDLFNGASKVYTLQADSEGHVGADKFYYWWDSFFWATKSGQTGVQDIVFWAGDTIVARWYILKTDRNGNTAFCNAYYNDGSGNDKLRQAYSFNFQSSHKPDENPFCETRGSSDFLKIGADLRFYYDAKYYNVSVPFLKDKEITKVSNTFANVYGRTGDEYVTNNMIRKAQIRKMYVDKWNDIPNRYGAGSELVIDTETANAYLNGLPANDEAINPPLFAPLQPGDNKIEFYQSDWSQSVPEVTVEWKERYL